jgi:hypothetical protein
MTLAMTKPIERIEQRPRPKREIQKRSRPAKHDSLKITAYSAVALTLGFSGWLNGEANVYYAGEGY